jgi:hypothetical protein
VATANDAVEERAHLENPILDFTDTLAKRELLAQDKLRAHFAGAIAAARPRGLAPVINFKPDDDKLVGLAAVPAPADGLKTPVQAARRLGISIRTLRGLVNAGDLRYVNVGRGKQREKIMFTDSDLDDLIASRTRQKAQSCPSISLKARRSTSTTSSGEVLVFTARRSGQAGGKRKR